MLNYFAYGSNMSVARLQDRLRIGGVLGVGTLYETTLRWHKRSIDGSGKCDAFATGNSADKIIGVVYQIEDSQKPRLDRAEGLGKGYTDRIAQVRLGDRIVAAVLYVADPDFIDSSLKPYDWYKEHVVRGAEEHGLPEEYLTQIRAVSAIPDPKPERARTERALYGTDARTTLRGYPRL
jgi:gamma-glutamylcyclotransferase